MRVPKSISLYIQFQFVWIYEYIKFQGNSAQCADRAVRAFSCVCPITQIAYAEHVLWIGGGVIAECSKVNPTETENKNKSSAMCGSFAHTQ